MKIKIPRKESTSIAWSAAAPIAGSPLPGLAADRAPKSRALFSPVPVFDGRNAKGIENASVLLGGKLIKQIWEAS